MVTYLKKYNLKKNNHKIIIFIEGDFNNLELRKDIKFIFKHLNFKIINLKLKNFNLFTLTNFFEWRKIFLINNLNYKTIEKALHKNKINLNDYSEILYSNERISNYINYMFKGRKIFFFHGIGDIKIFIKQNYIKEFKNFLLFILNYRFNKIELPKKNSLTAMLFRNLLKPNFLNKCIMKININDYRRNFKKFSRKKINDIKFKPKENFILYILKFPRFKVKEENKNRANYLKNYLNFQFGEVNKFINQRSLFQKRSIIIKTKNNVVSKEAYIINKIANNTFKKNKVYFLTNRKNTYVNAEIFAVHFKCKGIISNISTADFVAKIINPKIKIFQYHNIAKKFNLNNEFYTKKNIDIKPSVMNKYYRMEKNINL